MAQNKQFHEQIEMVGGKGAQHASIIDLSHNTTGEYVVSVQHLARSPANHIPRIKNPLAGLSDEELKADVDEFVDKSQLGHDRALFQRAALIARAPGSYVHSTELSDDERDAFHVEKTQRWKHPRTL
jgi:hypothetical protein